MDLHDLRENSPDYARPFRYLCGLCRSVPYAAAGLAARAGISRVMRSFGPSDKNRLPTTTTAGLRRSDLVEDDQDHVGRGVAALPDSPCRRAG